VFDIGFTELMLIGIVALVVIGPERLPAVARTAGQWLSKLQRFVRGVKTDLASELDSGDLKKLIGDQRSQIDELKKMMNTAKQDFETSTRDVVDDAKNRINELETSVADKSDNTTDTNTGSASTSADSSDSEVDKVGAEGSGADAAQGQKDLSNQADKDSDIGRTGLFCGLFWFSQEIYTALAAPLLKHLPGSQMIAIDVAAPFFIPFKLTLMLCVFLAVPYLLYQIWSFIAPGLYTHEKRWIL